MIALTHLPSPTMEHGLRTFVAPSPIDHQKARLQHQAYCELLRQCGAAVRVLEVNLPQPDCAFIEDTAVVLDEVAVLASMGDLARRGETGGVETVLREYRNVHRVDLPATLEGGDVLRIGRTLLVGLSSRTDMAGVDALKEIVQPYGYQVRAVTVRGCLHLKTACTAIGDGRLLVNTAWINPADLADFQIVPVPLSEPWGANVLPLGGKLCLPAAHRATAEMVEKLAGDVVTVDVSELAKAEAGVTCLSLLIE
ncbi:MAG: arginine deiminase family protein [Pirellulales bacterium]